MSELTGSRKELGRRLIDGIDGDPTAGPFWELTVDSGLGCHGGPIWAVKGGAQMLRWAASIAAEVGGPGDVRGGSRGRRRPAPTHRPNGRANRSPPRVQNVSKSHLR